MTGRQNGIKKVEYADKFLRSAKRLPIRIFNQAEARERTFREDPFARQLGTHKLHGKEKGLWAFWVNLSYRIKFLFLNDEEVLFLDIGTHKIYK